MQGFILKITKSVREDIILNVITESRYETLYRFYGARHGILFTGRKIDFEIEYQGVYIPKMRNITHLARDYEKNLEKVFVWQQFCSLLDNHLKHADSISPFYFNLLDRFSKTLNLQDAKRLACCMQVELLEFEGRLYKDNKCFICGNTLNENVALARSFLLACTQCVQTENPINKKKLIDFYDNKSTINMSDFEVEIIYQTLLSGI